MANAEQTSLEDMMIAMDVVDTLRHRQGLVDRELDAENRRTRLVEKLRDIYAAQGIEVTEAMLAEGVLALEEDRFNYQPAKGSNVWLAKIYVKRSLWLKPLLIGCAILLAVLLFRFFFFTYPESRQLSELPMKVQETFNSIQKTAISKHAVTEAQELVDQAVNAIDDGDTDDAQNYYNSLKGIQTLLQQSYNIRIVSYPGEMSGVWRIPDANSNARNYYIIVEAVDRRGKVLSVPITSEESNKVAQVKRWGLRVDKSTFDRVGADKKDDGIIQNNIVGHKKSGFIKPDYSIKTTGSTISQW